MPRAMMQEIPIGLTKSTNQSFTYLPLQRLGHPKLVLVPALTSVVGLDDFVRSDFSLALT